MIRGFERGAVGWVERSETHRRLGALTNHEQDGEGGFDERMMDFAALDPSYALERYDNSPPQRCVTFRASPQAAEIGGLERRGGRCGSRAAGNDPPCG